ncbi:MAG: tetratricopeptide repeat protein [Gammaproteobacteria bacterium]|nr:MAG: tetratricopeptide repeat protein [Gammaproteobacteria bacterium]
MSLINQMLKDLEKRRSRDLETSASLSHNITWETRPNQKTFNWSAFIIISTLAVLLSVIGYLLWERTSNSMQISAMENIKPAAVKKVKYVKPVTRKKETIKKRVKTKVAIVNDYSQAVDAEEDSYIEEVNNTPTIKIKKNHRPLNSKQLAEIAYNKGYHFLQQGRMRQGKEHLRKALSLYIPHIKAREMLAGIYIKSGHFINAAELLNEGVKISPEYPLFAKLYARVLLEQNNPQLAIKILKQGSASVAMNVEPDYYALMAATYQRVKNHAKAVDIYLQLVKIRPAAGVWWLGLGISLEKSGKNKEALEAYQRAQKTGSLKAGLVKFTNNRVSALREIGFPEK